MLSIVVPARSPALTGLATELFRGPDRVRGERWFAVAAAVTLHALAGSSLASSARPTEAQRDPLEVEFLLPPPPSEAPAPIAPASRPLPNEPAAPMRPVTSNKAPPPAAHAGALLTARADAPAAQQSEEAVDFASDPNNATYGGGVVAVGGTADLGQRGAALGAPPVAAVAKSEAHPGRALTAQADLSRKPQLNESDPCRGFFPSGATEDLAHVSLMVVLAPSGTVSGVTLLSETPPGHGFGAAARACMSSKRFLPALNREGSPTATATRINVRFTR